MDTDGFRKAIHFDLDTATVEATFGKKNTSMAYRKIRKFLDRMVLHTLSIQDICH